MSLDNLPLVSIGMPVYNGETYLTEALKSLLAQDHPNLELIISDNASTDRTSQICREFVCSDTRIRYVRHGHNQGAPWNFAFVAQQAQGDYFMWAAYDDFWHPTYISKCLAKLRSCPSAVLCCSEINFVDAQGHPHPDWSKKGFKNLETLGMSPRDRVHSLISFCGWFAIYGLMPLEITKRLRLGLSEQGWDVICLMELLLLGDIAKVPEPLFGYRIVTPKTAEDYHHELGPQAGRSSATKAHFTDLAANLLKTVYQSHLPKEDQLAIFGDFVSTLTRSNSYWREQITSEICGEGSSLPDSQFAALLALALSRAVPFIDFRENPILQAFFEKLSPRIDTLRLAECASSGPSRATIQSRKALCTEAEHLFKQGKGEEAANLFQEALRHCENSEVWHDWAIARLYCGHFADAEEGLRRSLEMDPSNHLAAFKLGILLSQRGQNSQAIDYIAQAVPFLRKEKTQALQLLLRCISELFATNHPVTIPSE